MKQEVKVGDKVYTPRDIREESPYTVIKVYNKDNNLKGANKQTGAEYEVTRLIACNGDDCKVFTVMSNENEQMVFKINNIK